VDLDGEVSRGVIDRHQTGQVVQGEPVLEVALAGVARARVRQPDRLAVPEGLRIFRDPFFFRAPSISPPSPAVDVAARPETSATKRAAL